MRKFTLTLVLALACGGAFAAELGDAPFDAAQVLEQQRKIRTDADAGVGPYGQLNDTTRRELHERQDRLAKLLENRRYEDLSPEDRQKARVDLAWIEYAGKNDDDRLVCERVRRTGSNRVERVCKTVGQRRQEREESKRDADRAMQQRALEVSGPNG